MDRTDKLQTIYSALQNEGYTDLGDFSAFSTMMEDENNLRLVYDGLVQSGYEDVGDFSQFKQAINPIETQPTDSTSKVSQGRFGALVDEETPEEKAKKELRREERKNLFKGYMAAPSNVSLATPNMTEVKAMPKVEEPQLTPEQIRAAENEKLFKQHLKDSGQIQDLYNLRDYAREHDGSNGVWSYMNPLDETAPIGGAIHLLRSAFSEDYRAKKAAQKRNRLIAEQADKAIDVYEQATGDRNGISSVFNAVADEASRISTWDLGMTDLQNAATLYELSQKDESELTASEKATLDAIGLASSVMSLYGDEVGVGYKIGQGIPATLSFMGSMALNPAAGYGKKLAGDAVKKFGKDYVKRVAKRAAGDIIETGAYVASVALPQVGANALDRINGSTTYDLDDDLNVVYGGQEDQETLGNAIWKAFGETFIEGYTERVGDYFDPIIGFAKGVTKGIKAGKLSDFAEALVEVKPTATMQNIRRFKEKTLFNGTLSELMEEELGMIMNAYTVGDYTFDKEEAERTGKTYILDPENQFVTAMSVGMFSAAINGTEMAANHAYKRKVNKVAEKYGKIAERELGAQFSEMIDGVPSLRERIDNADADEKNRILADIWGNPNLNDRQKAAVAQYAIYRQYAQTFNAVQANALNHKADEVKEQHAAYEAGYSSALPAFYNIANAFKEAQQSVNDYTERTGDSSVVDAIQLIENNPSEIKNIRDGLTDEQYQLVTNYKNTLERYRGAYQGRSDKLEDYMDEVAFVLEPAINADTNGNRTITTAIYKDEPVYVTYNDGTNATIMRFNGEKLGDKTPLLTRDLSEIVSHDAEQYINGYRQQITGQMDAETENAFEHHPKTQAPQAGLQLQSPEGEVVITAINDNMVEIVPAVYKDGQVQPKEGAEPRTITVGDAYAWQDDYYLSMDADQAYANAMAEASNVSAETTENEGTPSEQIEQSVSEEVADGQIAETQPTEGVAESVAPATPQTARERVPKDKKGNPIYEQTDADTAWDAIVEETEGNVEMAQRVAADMLEDKKAALAKLQKGKPKKGTTVAEKIANEKAHAAAIAQAQNDVAQWEAIVGTENRRREAAMSEADRYAAEMEQKSINEGLAALGEPKSLEEYVLGQLAGGSYKLRWSDKENGTKGFGSHTGLSTEEMMARLSMIDNKNGLTPEEIAHSIVENMDASFGEVDVMDVTNMVIDAVSTHASRRAMLNGMVESRAELLRQQVRAEQEAKDAWYMEQYHATEEELAAYSEYLAEITEEIIADDANYEERFNTFAELIADEYENQGTDADIRSSADQGEGLASDREGSSSVGEGEETDRQGAVLGDAPRFAEAEDGRAGSSVSAESDVDAEAEEWAEATIQRIRELEDEIANIEDVISEFEAGERSYIVDAEIAALEDRLKDAIAERDGLLSLAEENNEGADFKSRQKKGTPAGVRVLDGKSKRASEEYARRTGWTEGLNDIQLEIVDHLRGLTDEELKDFRRQVADAISRDEEVEHNKYILDTVDRYRRSGEREHVKRESGILPRQDVSLDKIEELFMEYNRDENLAILFDRLRPLIEKINPRFIFDIIRDADGNVADKVMGDYSLKDNLIRINYHSLYSGYQTEQEKASTIVHEMIHAITQYAIDANERGDKTLPKNVLEAAKSLVNIYNQIKDNEIFNTTQVDEEGNIIRDYGVKDVHEMISELANPEFREKLKQIDVKGKNAWERIIDAIARFINQFKDIYDTTAYGKAVRALDALMDNFNLDAYERSRALGSEAKESRVGNLRFREKEDNQDAAYMDAVERGDMETAQRMVDEAARKAMKKTKVVDKDKQPMLMSHHTDAEGFYVFDRGKIGTGQGQSFLGAGFNFSRGSGSSVYGSRNIQAYLDARKPLRSDRNTLSIYQIEQIIKELNAISGDNIEYNFADNINRAARAISEYGGDLDTYASLCTAYSGETRDVLEVFEKLGFDSTIEYGDDKRIMNAVVFNSHQIKSAAPVTYDDNGNVIPLSERFNLKEDDIRFRDGERFHQGLSNNEIFDSLNKHTQYYGGGPSRLMQALEEYYKGEIVSASHNAGIAMSEGLVPVPDKKYAGIEEEYHHIEFRGEDGETFVEAVPFVKAEDVEKIYGILFRDGAPFFSNAERAVEDIKQNKATPEQWLAMIKKDGGLKAGEDKWMGLSDWLNDQKEKGVKTLTKDEVLQFIRENQIEIEEVEYGEEASERYIQLQDEFSSIVENIESEYSAAESKIDQFEEEMHDKYGDGFYYMLNEKERNIQEKLENALSRGENPRLFAYEDMISTYGDDFKAALEVDYRGRLVPTSGYNGVMSDEARHYLGINPINSIRLDYTTEGLDNKREIALVVPTIEPWNESDTIHFGDAGEGRAVAWVRFGETTADTDETIAAREAVDDYLSKMRDKYNAAEGEEMDYMADEELERLQKLTSKEIDLSEKKVRVLVIDEVQSKRHDEGRAKGYRNSRIREIAKRLNELSTIGYRDGLTEDQLNEKEALEQERRDIIISINPLIAEKAKKLKKEFKELPHDAFEDLESDIIAASFKLLNGVPDAPFDKNYHELVMKRMLRYAAENGYDKVAWTKGKQQAERYNLAKHVSSIEYKPLDNGHYNVIAYSSLGYPLDGVPMVYDSEQAIADVFGKDIAQQIAQDVEENRLKAAETEQALSELKEKRKELRRRGVDEDSAEFEETLEEFSRLSNKLSETQSAKFIEGTDLSIGGEDRGALYDKMIPSFMRKYVKKWGTTVGEVTLPNVEEAGRTMWSVDVTPEMRESVMQGQPMFREGMGAISDREVSYENDPIAKFQGKPRYYGKRAAAFAERERRRMENAAKEAAEMLGIEAEIVTDASTLQGRKAKAKGWYDIVNKKVVVVVPNHVSMGDAVRTVLHEGVAHHGLRELFGDGFDAMLDNVYNNVAPELKARIDAIAERTGVSTSVATEEYLASLAETTNFEEAKNRGWWAKIKQYFVKMLDKLGMPGLKLKEELTDNELRYLLWRSYKNLVEPNSYLRPLGYAEDVVKQKELKVGQYAEAQKEAPIAAETSEAEEWAAITMQRIEELEAQAAQLENEIAEMEAKRDADDASRYEIWEQQLEPLRKQMEANNQSVITEGEHKGEGYGKVYGKKAKNGLRYREDSVSLQHISNQKASTIADMISDCFYDDVAQADRIAMVEYLQQSEDGREVIDRLYEHRGSGWARQAVNATMVRIALHDLINGREPSVQSMLTRGAEHKVVSYVRRMGAEGVWRYLEEKDFLSEAAKPLTNVNGSFLSCNPSAECAKYCYATKGHYTYAGSTVKSELVYWAVDADPNRAADRIYREYQALRESAQSKALRLFDKGDLDEAWLPVIEELNRRGIVTQIFSKRSEVLQRVDDTQNVVMLSIDHSNADMLEQYPTMPIAFVYRGRQDMELLEQCKERFLQHGGVILPVKVGQKVLSKEELEALPSWTRPYQCPIDNGTKQIVNKENPERSWNCTKCDRNGGVGCFFKRTAKQLKDNRNESKRDGLVSRTDRDGERASARNEEGGIGRTSALHDTNGGLGDSEIRGGILQTLRDGGIPDAYITPELVEALAGRIRGWNENGARGRNIGGAESVDAQSPSDFGREGGKRDRLKRTSRIDRNSEEIIAEVERESAALGVSVRIARSVDELPDADTRKRAVDGKLKGYFDPRTNEVVFYEPNTNDANDAKRTILHEIVGHKGLRQLIGEQRYDKAMLQLMYMLPADVRDAVLRRAERHGWNAAIAMDEYLADQAERDVQPTWWGKVNAKVRALLRNMGFNVMLTDADVTYLLWRSRKKLQGDDLNDMAVNAILKQAARKSAEAEAWNEQAFQDAEMRDFERSALPSIRHRMGADVNDYEKAVRTLGFKQAEAWQDSMRSLHVFQTAIAKASGKDITDFENAYMYENRMSSANLMEMEQYRHMVYNPLLKEIHEMEQMGASRESIINYLFAKSGLERNEVFARRDAKKHAEGDATKEQQLYDKYRQKDYAGLTALTRGDAQIAALVDDHSKKKTEYDRLEQNKKRGVTVSDADLKAAKKEMDDARKAMIAAIEAEAQRMVDEFEAQHNTDNLWDKIRNCTHTTLNISHDAGVMSDEVYNELWNQFQYYIPLRGFAETTAEDVYLYLGGNDSPYNAPIKTAYGRTSLADDPIATIGNMAESAIVEANRNRLKQRFLYMVERHNTDLASISDVWLEYDDVNDEWHTVFAQIPDDATPSEAKRLQQEFEDRMKQLAEQNPGKYANASQQPNIPYRVVKKGDRQEHHVIVKRNGKDVVITINGNPRVAQAINGLTNPEQNNGPVQRIVNWVNRNLSANFTMRNPAFMVSNFVRDGFYTNSMVWVKENPAYARQYNKNWAICTAQIASLVKRYKRYEKGDTSALDMNNDMDRMFYEFMINGGETGYTVIKSVEDYKGLISGEMKKMEAGAMGTARRVADTIGNVVDTFGRWAEDTSRFAAYMTSRQLGRTITKSIWDAKEISVNFNKKGSGNRMMGKFEQGNRWNYVLSNMSQLGRNLYVFWNAGMQGLNNFKNAAKKSPAKFTAMAGTYFTLGVIVAAAFSGDDDEDDYYNLPEYVRRNNICFKIGKGKYATLPLPIEIRAIYGLGELAYSYLSGREGLTHGEAVTKTIQQMTQVLPIDMMADGGGAMALVPSAAKPVVEVAFNVDWTGRPIYKEKTPWNQNDPTWTLAFKSTSPEFIEMSRLVNEWTNKNTADGLERPYNRGWADNRYLNNPAVWEHIMEGYLGGMATMFNQTKKTLMMPFNEDLREVRNVPIASRFIKDAGKEGRSYAARNEYYDAKNIMDSWKNEMSKAKKEVLDESLTDEQRLKAAKLRSSLEQQYMEAAERWKVLDRQRKALEEAYKNDQSEENRQASDDVMMQMATLVEAYRD